MATLLEALSRETKSQDTSNEEGVATFSLKASHSLLKVEDPPPCMVEEMEEISDFAPIYEFC